MNPKHQEKSKCRNLISRYLVTKLYIKRDEDNFKNIGFWAENAKRQHCIA